MTFNAQIPLLFKLQEFIMRLFSFISPMPKPAVYCELFLLAIANSAYNALMSENALTLDVYLVITQLSVPIMSPIHKNKGC